VDKLIALSREGTLCAPQVGVWKPDVRAGDALEGGRGLGVLKVLGRLIAVTAPIGASGEVAAVRRAGPMGYGDVLVEVGERSAGSRSVDSGADAASVEGGGIAVRSPIDGIFYCRSAPEAPAFVKVGDAIVVGQTLGLVEVMKTFNPIRAEIAGTVLSVDAGDQQEVSVGAVLVVIAPS